MQEHIGQLNFYLEYRNRDVHKEMETRGSNPFM